MASEQHKGLFYGLAAFFLWGAFPIFWKELIHVSPFVTIAHRLIWSTVLLFFIILIRGRLHILLDKLKQPKYVLSSFLNASLLATNWIIYVWATNNGKVVEISLGYYILPLLLIVFGYFLLKEKLTKLGIIAVLIATVGVIIQGYGLGRIPWPAIGVAASFAIYGVLKKVFQSDGFTALIIETASLTPFAIGFLIYNERTHGGSWGNGSGHDLLFIFLTGLVTTSPLLFFTAAAKRTDLTTLGMLQFVAPTGQFFIGILYFNETLNFTQLISFSFIWLAVVVYLFSKRTTKLKVRSQI